MNFISFFNAQRSNIFSSIMKVLQSYYLKRSSNRKFTTARQSVKFNQLQGDYIVLPSSPSRARITKNKIALTSEICWSFIFFCILFYKKTFQRQASFKLHILLLCMTTSEPKINIFFRLSLKKNKFLLTMCF